MKDFYDIYVLIKENTEKIDFKNLIIAIKNTFKNRETELNIEDIREQLSNIYKIMDKIPSYCIIL